MFAFLVTLAVAGVGYWQSRRFVTSRLRYVDAVHSPWAAAIAGVAAAAIAYPFAFLPVITATTAVVFGGSVAIGVTSGAREIRKRLGA